MLERSQVESLRLCNSRRANTEAGGTVTVAIGGRVDSEDNGLGASLFSAGKELLGLSVVAAQVQL